MATSSNSGLVSTPVERDACGDCSKLVQDRAKGLLCEVCSTWYHIKCQAVPLDVYSLLQKNESIHWYCKGCERGVAKLLQSMALLQKRQDILENDVESIKGDISVMKSSIQSLDTKIECMVEAKLCDAMTEKNDKNVEVKIKVVSDKVEEELEIERRKYNLIFHGIAADETMSDVDIVKHVVAHGLKLDHTRHVEDVTRIGKSVEGKVRPIRVKVRSLESKKEMLQRAKNLKDNDMLKRIYITPDLTRKQQEIDKKLRDNLKKIRAEGEPTAKIQGDRVIKNRECTQVVVLYEPPKC
jgi:hypothetical protein